MNTDDREIWILDMNRIVKYTTVVLTGSVFFSAVIDTQAQLASTNLDGIQISVENIYRSGDSRDLDCAIGLKFTGDKADRAIGMSSATIIEAKDDTGMDLMRTNQPVFAGNNWPPAKTISGFAQNIHRLKAPAPNAKTIRHLEAEVDFFTPTASTPVVTNFMSRPGQVLHQTTLDQYQIKIVCDNKANDASPGSLVIDSHPGKSFLLRVDDPQNKVVKLAFQKPDGKILVPTGQSTGVFGTRKDYTFNFQQPPSHDLNLVVYVAAPEATDKVRFSLDNIRLPWIDQPDFQAAARVSKGFNRHPDDSTNAFTCYLSLMFSGGQLTNTVGIRNVWVSQAEDDTGKAVIVRYAPDGDGRWSRQFDALPPVMSNGRYVRKFVPLAFQSHDPKMIRVIKGEAELVGPDATTEGRVVITNFLNHDGTSFDVPILKTNRVSLTFLGLVNYAAKYQKFRTTSVSESGQPLPAEVPATNKNSLEFILDDPENVVIAPFGNGKLNFHDAQGRDLQFVRVMTSGKHIVYRLKAPLPPDTELVLYLAIPESLQRVPFEIKDVPLDLD